MDLKHNKITVGQLLDYPPAHAVLKKQFPMVMRHPLMGAARTMTLEQVLSAAGAYVPQKKLEQTLEELRRV